MTLPTSYWLSLVFLAYACILKRCDSNDVRVHDLDHDHVLCCDDDHNHALNDYDDGDVHSDNFGGWNVHQVWNGALVLPSYFVYELFLKPSDPGNRDKLSVEEYFLRKPLTFDPSPL